MTTSIRRAARHAQARRLRRDAGLTLIELMVVVVILALLAVVIVPRVIDRPDQARAARAQSDIAAIASALNLYRLDTGAYPSTEQGLDALVQRPGGQPEAPNWKSGGYLQSKAVPKDPWGRPYLYLNPGRRADIDVYTLGADGRPGGEAENADVGNWVD